MILETILLLLILPVNSLWCLGFYNACNYVPEEKVKGALWFIPYLLAKFPDWVKKPVFDCMPCMASLHSLWFWLFFDMSKETIFLYILYIPALSGFNLIIDKIYDVD